MGNLTQALLSTDCEQRLSLSSRQCLLTLTSASHGGDNQKWQIAAVGDSKYVIINRKTGSYVYAKGKTAQAGFIFDH